jgi:lipoprotein-anchoring transpeptidase ErfK/SrfK
MGGVWFRERDIAIAAKPSKLPAWAKDNKRWVDIGIQSQTLVLYEGNRAVYATAVSTGRDGLGDPKKTLSTPTGTFSIREKHVTTTMDANEVDNKFELRDVPWVQYFKGGYALHAALWHDEFGKPRSHGCINLAPLDAKKLFQFTGPGLPSDWHGVSTSATTGEGTTISIHP